MITYLWHIFDECDTQLDVGEIVEVSKPGDHMEEGDHKRHNGEHPQ